MHEVIVAGAGPAGSTAALALARAGRDVLLLDRQSFPRDKVCGDGVTWTSLATLDQLGLGARLAGTDFNPVDRLRLVSPNATVYESRLQRDPHGRYGPCIAPRLKLDALIYAGACAAGAQFRQAQVTAPIVEQGRVVGVRARDAGGAAEREERAPLVIAADGATSALARALLARPPGDVHRAVSLRAYVEGMDLDPGLIEFYLYREILPGYSWIFPTGAGTANVGTGMRLDIFKRIKGNLREYFDHFLRMPAIAPRVQAARIRNVASWQLTLGSHNFSRVFPGALLVGDAGSFVDPLTGGGIQHAIVTGRMAAEIGIAALAARDFSREFLARFDRGWRTELWHSLRNSSWVARLVVHSPGLVDFLFAQLKRFNWGLETLLARM